MPDLSWYRVRVTCHDDERGAIHISSDLDQTYKLDHRTDDDLGFTEKNLIRVRNAGETPQKVSFKSIRVPVGDRVVLKPSRQATRTLCSTELSEIRSECEITLGGGESIMIHSSKWQPRYGTVMPGI